MKKVLITFGDKAFEETRDRLKREAIQFGHFDEVIAFGMEDLDGEFMARHGEFIRRNPRGSGYWIWKPHLIGRTLATLKEGDLLVYADAGCSINPAGEGRLREYFRRVQDHPSGLLAFELTGMPNQDWTKMDVIAAMNASDHMQKNMLMASIIVMRNCEAARELARQWVSWCDRYDLVSDALGKSPNHSDFKEHRHDQSIFSLLGRIHGVDFLPDETYGPHARGAVLTTRLRPKRGVIARLKRSVAKRREKAVQLLGLRSRRNPARPES